MPAALEERLAMLSFGRIAGFGRIRIFRQVSMAGPPAASGEIFKRFNRLPDGVVEEDAGVLDRMRSMAMQLTYNSLAEAQSAIDAASLVFAHSLLDDCASECCRISLLADPGAWMQDIVQRKVSVEQLQSSSLDQILADLRASYVEQLTKDALMKRLDTLNAKCQPVAPLRTDGVTYAYDRDRVKNLDALRHQIVHRPAEQKRLPTTLEDDLQFADNTCRFLTWMISQRHGITDITDITNRVA